MVALPLDDAGPYVAAAYLVFLALVLLYVAIMAAKVARMERDLSELADAVQEAGPSAPGPAATPPEREPVGSEGAR
ncbi:MAG: hypothetical protein ACR2NA_10885 [Solirubrobacterales bacterium]